jgi:hypothetical protein
MQRKSSKDGGDEQSMLRHPNVEGNGNLVNICRFFGSVGFTVQYSRRVRSVQLGEVMKRKNAVERDDGTGPGWDSLPAIPRARCRKGEVGGNLTSIYKSLGLATNACRSF